MIDDLKNRNKLIKKKLIDLEMSQKTLADKLGTKPAYLNDVLSGRKSGKKYEEQIFKILADEEQLRKGKSIS